MSETIHIYHTNDFHSHFENWPRIRRFLQERKKWHEEAGESVLIFDIGDHIDRSHPYTEATLGKGNVKLLNKAGYDGATIGNNEGMTLPKEGLNHLYEEAAFPVICANLYDENGKRPSWCRPYHIYELKNGWKVGVTGVTAYLPESYHLLGWKITLPLDELKAQVEYLAQETDLVVVLSHLGMHEDDKIAQEMEEVDIVMGAHTHHIYHQGKWVNDTLLAAAGKFGNYVGHIVVEIEPASKKGIEKKALLYDVHELKPAIGEEEETARYQSEGKRLLSQPVVKLDRELSIDWFKASPLAEWLCEGLREWCDADCAIINAGLLLRPLRKGTITKFDLHQLLPHPINPCTITLNGGVLKKIIDQTLDEKWPHMQVKGFGFRGKIWGEFVYDRIDIDRDNGSVKINGQELNLDKQYRLAVPDLFTYGAFFPELVRTQEKQYYMPEFLRDLMEWKLVRVFG
ncbi:bifunctional UDP-sugar hydrolase/5'-nucleotidase [Bacillus sp. FSL W8-1127]|uniref:bifunctional metallophosphatase/5'-nucleotidase n=1 Tax=unclassified Bacillus (in: firmicutes) TaxID=185979 RepID=UPI0030F8BCED